MGIGMSFTCMISITSKSSSSVVSTTLFNCFSSSTALCLDVRGSMEFGLSTRGDWLLEEGGGVGGGEESGGGGGGPAGGGGNGGGASSGRGGTVGNAASSTMRYIFYYDAT